MKYKSRITCVATQQAVVIDHDWNAGSDSEEEQQHHIQFLWEEGNGSCDCYRAQQFLRALDELTDEIEEGLVCSEGKYKVELLFQDDDDWWEVLS